MEVLKFASEVIDKEIVENNVGYYNVFLAGRAWADFEWGVRGTRAGMVAPLLRSQAERGSAGERNFASLGQNERPREKQVKTGPANCREII